MEYLEIVSGQPTKITNIRGFIKKKQKELGKSLPALWQVTDKKKRDRAMATLGALPVVTSPKPVVSGGQSVKLGGYKEVDGVWQTDWVVVDATAQEVRSKRNRLLSASDWTQLLDSPVDQSAWATYRQALRDIPEQVGFPTNVTWPTEPS